MDAGCLPPSLSTLMLEIGYFTEPGTHRIGNNVVMS